MGLVNSELLTAENAYNEGHLDEAIDALQNVIEIIENEQSAQTKGGD